MVYIGFQCECTHLFSMIHAAPMVVKVAWSLIILTLQFIEKKKKKKDMALQ